MSYKSTGKSTRKVLEGRLIDNYGVENLEARIRNEESIGGGVIPMTMYYVAEKYIGWWCKGKYWMIKNENPILSKIAIRDKKVKDLDAILKEAELTGNWRPYYDACGDIGKATRSISDWSCSHCNEENDYKASRCWKCSVEKVA